MDVSLFVEVVMVINALIVPSFGASSQALVGTVVQSSPEPSGGVVGKSPPSSLLQRGFLLPSAHGVAHHLLPKDGVGGVPSLLGVCITRIIEKGVDVRLNGSIQSRKWLVGSSPYGEIIVRDQGDGVWVGEDGDSPHPLGVYTPDRPLDWVLDGDEEEDPSLAILDSIEEDFLQEVKVAHLKANGRRGLLNPKSSIYGDVSASSQRGKGKTHML
jgi:hypothetical protein